MNATRRILTPTAAALMQQAMQAKPQSLLDLVKVSGLSKRLVTRYVRELQAATLVHVGGWAHDTRGYPTIELYMWGKGADVPCPVTDRTPADRMRLLRAARKGEPLEAPPKPGTKADALRLQNIWHKPK